MAKTAHNVGHLRLALRSSGQPVGLSSIPPPRQRVVDAAQQRRWPQDDGRALTGGHRFAAGLARGTRFVARRAVPTMRPCPRQHSARPARSLGADVARWIAGSDWPVAGSITAACSQ
ncbi:MAG: hypothetical protein QOF01_1438 [Thermomicrobiales bacterium]|nr:hypothetical protein [Thermomicrobiales bacterium]